VIDFFYFTSNLLRLDAAMTPKYHLTPFSGFGRKALQEKLRKALGVTLKLEPITFGSDCTKAFYKFTGSETSFRDLQFSG
jgi:hypothetical protein